MSNDDVQAIFLVIFLIALLAVVFIPLALFFGYAFFLKWKRDQTRAAILQEHQQLIGNHSRFPVRYASELRFKSMFKIFPWEGAGILVMVPGSVLFLGQTSSGPVSLQFAPGNSTVNWLGKAPWPNGAVSWFFFETAARKEYFSSETGVLVFGSHKSTKAIYDAASQSFLPTSAP
ncbi:MAG TPA: hypothetical protein VGN90_08655 [Pyrinomonadaceae bacterium]|jgi:hypothetical protein|nr:hypothetical protein [Pyrinomonadaceae bacterium]